MSEFVEKYVNPSAAGLGVASILCCGADAIIGGVGGGLTSDAAGC